MKIVPDWRRLWRWHSTWFFGVLAVILPVWQELPPDIKSMVPAEWRPWIVSLIAVAGLILRLRQQPEGPR